MPDILYGLICVSSGCTATQQTTLRVGKEVTNKDVVHVYKNCMAYCILYVLSFLFSLSTIFRYGGLTGIILCFITATGHGYCGIGFFSGKATMDTVNGWFYRDRIWIQRNRIFSGKARVDPVHIWSYRDRIWIQWDEVIPRKGSLDPVHHRHVL